MNLLIVKEESEKCAGLVSHTGESKQDYTVFLTLNIHEM